jgi:hypothetical protein
MGSAIVPIPYAVISKLDSAIGVVTTVKLNGHEAVVFGQSQTASTKGDAQGKACGLKSNTVELKCEPLTKSSSVRAGKKWIVRHGDRFWMNGA